MAGAQIGERFVTRHASGSVPTVTRAPAGVVRRRGRAFCPQIRVIFSESLGVPPVALILSPHTVGFSLGFVSTAPTSLGASPGEESFDSLVF